VECAFGEIDQRWGIFWRPLRFSLQHNIQTIDAALRLHNVIVDYNLKHGLRPSIDTSLYDDDCLAFLFANPNEIIGVFGDGTNAEVRVRGTPPNIDRDERALGVQWRDALCQCMAEEGLMRPSANWYRDQFNHIRER